MPDHATASTSLINWALPQLARLLPLDPDSLRELLTYTLTLTKQDAADHLKNLLGDSAQSLDFISSFNTRSQSKVKEPRQNTHALPARQSAGPASSPSLARNLGLKKILDATQSPAAPSVSRTRQDATTLQAPTPKSARINITGGTPMHGAGTAIADLDSAIRSLEVQTNPSLSHTPDKSVSRHCNCMATRHPLLTIAPNCLNCGKIVCIKEGLGPCTFCHRPLLSSTEIGSVLNILKEERGKEKMAANNAMHKKAQVTTSKPRAFTGREFLAATSSASSSRTASPAPPGLEDAPTPAEDSLLANAKDHRDRLLQFQAQNARRTKIHDEVADFEVPSSGTNMWASPQERAKQLKQQQKLMREMDYNNRPEWEKKKQVMSIEVVGNKVVKKMVTQQPVLAQVEDNPDDYVEDTPRADTEGAFSRNPLLGSLIRPVVPNAKTKGTRSGDKTWRRVQDDFDDNEAWILDGGMYGGPVEEHAVA